MYRIITLLLLASSSLSAQAPPLDTLFQPMKWRCIGPFRGGRSVAACGVTNDPRTYYMGTTGGGLWKTEDMGLSWRNISDGYFKTGSVGAIAVAESDPNVIYVGMGEHAVRGVMTHHGDGVYRSTDAGKTWKKTGLDATQHIARVVVHPTDPNTVLVAAQGALYGSSKERGIYKSTDGGATWRQVLYVNEHTGCSELSMDPTNPRILYAGTWDYGRKPWQVKSGGPGSALYKSADGGETWEKMTEGLPKDMGKTAVSVCRSNPERVYALIESDWSKDAGGLYVSHNAGKSWSQVSSDHRLIQRAWYYIELFADPTNEHTLYVLSAPALRSIDGGNTWETLSGTHGDFHDLWINPRDPRNMVIANDGGAAITFNAGKTWSTQDNMPTAQIYRISVDNRFPYRIYGGQQDNSSIAIAHREFASGHIGRASWESSAGGESAFLAFNPDDPRYVLGGSYQGTIEVWDSEARAGTNIMAAPIQYLGRDAKDCKYRYNWNAPIIRSRHEPDTYFHGAQVLLRTDDMGKSWTEASPDLTRNDTTKQGKGGVPFTNEAVGAENYGTIAYVEESPHERGVIWTGSDDGLVHLTRDGGKSWQNVTPKGLAECLVNAIEVSPHDKSTAYIATTRYKFNDHAPGIYRTSDYGKTWTKISDGLPGNAFTRVVREDPVRRDLLFAGTELGLFVSWNGGASWQPFQLNLPVTPITDLKIHQGDLIAATSGRSFWILDDLTLLRQYDGKAGKDLLLFQPKPAYLANGRSELDRTDLEFTGTHPYEGVNPANGVVIHYHLADTLQKDEEMTLVISDAEGKVVRSFSSTKKDAPKRWDSAPPLDPVLPARKGLNRFVWNMRHPTMPGVPGVYIESSFTGHKAPAGTYTLTLQRKDASATASAEILDNPLYPKDAAVKRQYHDMMLDMERKVTEMHDLVNQLHAKRLQLDDLLKKLATDTIHRDLHIQGFFLSKSLKAWDDDMVQRQSKAYDDVENFPNKFTANYLFLHNQTESDIPRVNQPSIDRKRELDAEWASLRARAMVFLDTDIPTFNRALWEAGIGGIWAK